MVTNDGANTGWNDAVSQTVQMSSISLVAVEDAPNITQTATTVTATEDLGPVSVIGTSITIDPSKLNYFLLPLILIMFYVLYYWIPSPKSQSWKMRYCRLPLQRRMGPKALYLTSRKEISKYLDRVGFRRLILACAIDAFVRFLTCAGRYARAKCIEKELHPLFSKATHSPPNLPKKLAIGFLRPYD